jgi:hypothetical protein
MTSTFATSTWDVLGADHHAEPERFDPATLDALPPPARRLLAGALPAGTPLDSVVQLEMTGHIKLVGRWLPFTARQILRAGVGFVWTPVVGGRIIRFVGADACGPDGAHVEFRFHGRIPVMRASGPDTERSAAGRLAAETVAWLPQQITPQASARWEPIDDRHAAVTLEIGARDVRVEVGVDADGRLESIGLRRWKDSARPPVEAPFGGTVHSTFDHHDGVRIAGTGSVGWDWRTPRQRDSEFFRYEITSATFGNSPPADTTNTMRQQP